MEVCPKGTRQKEFKVKSTSERRSKPDLICA